jgi:hypothetical protein
VYADLLSRKGFTLPAAIDSTAAVIQAAPVQPGDPLGARTAGHWAATLGCRPTGYLSPRHRRGRGAGRNCGAPGAARRPRSGTGCRRRLLPVGAVLTYRSGLHGSIREELR